LRSGASFGLQSCLISCRTLGGVLSVMLVV